MTQPVGDPSRAEGRAGDGGPAEDDRAVIRPRELDEDDAGDTYEPI